MENLGEMVYNINALISIYQRSQFRLALIIQGMEVCYLLVLVIKLVFSLGFNNLQEVMLMAREVATQIFLFVFTKLSALYRLPT
jgi:hypothetical protein